MSRAVRGFCLAAGSLSAGLVASPALAANTSTSLGVSATVSANCSVSSTAVGFGSVDTLGGANVDANGALSVTCTNGTGWTASAGVGGGSGATFASRKMSSGSNRLNYTLYTDSNHANVWGDGTGTTSLLSGTGTGAAQSVTVYGRVFSGQTSVPAGSYSDTVSVTVTY